MDSEVSCSWKSRWRPPAPHQPGRVSCFPPSDQPASHHRDSHQIHHRSPYLHIAVPCHLHFNSLLSFPVVIFLLSFSSLFPQITFLLNLLSESLCGCWGQTNKGYTWSQTSTREKKPSRYRAIHPITEWHAGAVWAQRKNTGLTLETPKTLLRVRCPRSHLEDVVSNSQRWREAATVISTSQEKFSLTTSESFLRAGIYWALKLRARLSYKEILLKPFTHYNYPILFLYPFHWCTKRLSKWSMVTQLVSDKARII